MLMAKIFLLGALIWPFLEPTITLGAVLISATLAILGIVQTLFGAKKWKPMVERAEMSEMQALKDAEKEKALAEEREHQITHLRSVLDTVGGKNVYAEVRAATAAIEAANVAAAERAGDAVANIVDRMAQNHQETLDAIHELTKAIASNNSS